MAIARPCRNVRPEEALDYVMGYTIANDVTARRWQGKRGANQVRLSIVVRLGAWLLLLCSVFESRFDTGVVFTVVQPVHAK